MKRAEKVAWHALLSQQESEGAAQRAQIEERKNSQAFAAETRLIEARKGEVEVCLVQFFFFAFLSTDLLPPLLLRPAYHGIP